jgi:hypothetical protein
LSAKKIPLDDGEAFVATGGANAVRAKVKLKKCSKAGERARAAARKIEGEDLLIERADKKLGHLLALLKSRIVRHLRSSAGRLTFLVARGQQKDPQALRSKVRLR